MRLSCRDKATRLFGFVAQKHQMAENSKELRRYLKEMLADVTSDTYIVN
jgi:hypothetical protein